LIDKSIVRRDFLKTLLSGIPLMLLDWDAFPKGQKSASHKNRFDAIIIGSGLGGLSCAAAFVRQGLKPLVLEQHIIPGGYATSFKRQGGFVFDASLHSTTVGEREGVHNLIPGFPEIKEVKFVPHPNLYRTIFPEHDITVPQRDVAGYMEMLISLFPEEKEGIKGIFEDMKGLARDIDKYSASQGKIDMSRFPSEYPFLFKCFNKTWGEILGLRIENPKLKAIISSLWGYFGLPPSRLASIYYALPFIGYMQQGGFYPIGRSQKISDTFVAFIEKGGGKVKLGTAVDEILVKDQSAYGIRTADGNLYKGRVVVSNANAYDTFHTMLKEGDYLKDYLTRMDKLSVSLSCFQVFLGLKKDLVSKTGISDSEIFVSTDYDMEADYQANKKADVENSGYGLALYDNIYRDYSPSGKNTLNIIVLQGFDHWKKYEADYWKGRKEEYRAEKERMADILISRVEKDLLPGLSEAIEVKEIGTPLTNIRYTRNYRGAIYGWDQTLDNSGPRRLPHKTPIKDLYLSGAWTSPGHGYSAVIYSGLECFAEIMKTW
jgi:phytoene dehydrogenase-like protein